VAQRKLGYLCYNTFLALAAPVILFRLLIAIKSRLKFKYLSGGSKPKIWIHATSKPQLSLVVSILQEWVRIFPGYQPFLTYNGKNTTKISKCFDPEHQLIILPYPIEFCSRQNINRINPCLMILIEDCFYPRLIRLCKKNGSKVALIEGRVNKRLNLIHRLAPGFLRTVLQQVDLFLMNSVDEANGIGKLGAKLSSILVSNADHHQNEPSEENGFKRDDSLNKAMGALLGRNLEI
jgi:3-deoxy-D-manno-octulosonic-acid transferase